MIIQIFNLSDHEIFGSYSKKYRIFREVYSVGLLGLELRDIPANFASEIRKIVLNGNEICYKYITGKDEKINLFITGSLIDFKKISKKILADGDEDLGYKIINVIKNYEDYEKRIYKIGDKEFSFDKSYVMGILNVTPDSFSDGGIHFNREDAIKYGIEMFDNGADIIDIGGESTRPNADEVTTEEEISRVIPVIKGILTERPGALISVDTTKPVVAEEALKCDAKIINDISGLTMHEELATTVKKYNAAIIIMHIKGNPKTMQVNPAYSNLIREVYDFLYLQSLKASRAGIKNIFIDPGIGFGKTVDNNFEIIKRLEDFRSLGFPVVIGSSRKSFLGKTLDLEPMDRDAASAMMNSVSIRNGARIIRTHNVSLGVQAVKLMNKLC